MYKICFYFIILSWSINGFTQATTDLSEEHVREEILYDTTPIENTSLDENAIQNYKNNPDYNYIENEPEDNWLTRLKGKLSDIWNSFLQWLSGGKEATGILAFLLEILPYLLLIGLLSFLVWVFLKIDNTRSYAQTNLNKVFIGDDEEIIKNQDIQALIDQALKDKNYRLAVRYYYLFTLQKLSTKELIDWQVQKTNHEYLYEIENTDLRSQFSNLTSIYDYTWYGNFEVDASAFAKAQHAFTKINNEI